MTQPTNDSLALKNGESTELDAIAALPADSFHSRLVEETDSGKRISAMFARPAEDRFQIIAVVTDDKQGRASIISTEVGDSFKSDVAGPANVGIKGIHLVRSGRSRADCVISSLHDVLDQVT